jgi:hypothetical protein
MKVHLTSINLVGIVLLHLQFIQTDFFPIEQTITLAMFNQTHPTQFQFQLQLQLQLQLREMETIIYNHYHQVTFNNQILSVTMFPISLPLLGQTNIQSRSVNLDGNMKINH